VSNITDMKYMFEGSPLNKNKSSWYKINY
jgi:hypothetical protein